MNSEQMYEVQPSRDNPFGLAGVAAQQRCDPAPLSTAPALLQQAATIMVERGKQYDKPDGERSMAQTINAFNAITGQDLDESHGWLLMTLLKMVRDSQSAAPHRDSCEDMIAYAALYGESRLAGDK